MSPTASDITASETTVKPRMMILLTVGLLPEWVSGKKSKLEHPDRKPVGAIWRPAALLARA